MIGNLSDAAVEAMSIATAESQRFSQYYVGTEHLFIGLCKMNDPDLARGFEEAGFDAVYWRRKVRAAISVAGSSTAAENIEITPTTRLFPLKIGQNVKAQLENDLSLELDAVPRLNGAIKTAVEVGDNGSRELFEKILIDEEHHVDWLEAQLHIISEIGVENYLAQQMHE